MRKIFAFLVFGLLFCAVSAGVHAQTWTGILNPVSGAGACSPASISSPQKCAIDWSIAGVVGGIPSGTWTQSGSTITATSGDRTATIQAALTACGTNHFVLLGIGTFNVTNLTIPSNCVLRGSGTLTTIVNSTGTSGAVYSLGSGGPSFTPTSTNITSGATAGSTSIVVASASGISVGTLLSITELNDAVYVTPNTSNGTCTWCDGTSDSAARVRGQTVQVTNVSGTTLTISPGLYTAYGVATGTSPAQAWPFAVGGQNEGVELLQTYANGTGYTAVYAANACVNCWVKQVFDNYADADHVDLINGLHDEVRDSYFSNDYVHAPGSTDAEIDLQLRTSASLVENNILERLHVGVMAEWGASGNVVGYNYEIGNFDSSCGCNVIMEAFDDHGAHPQFNLFEGNIGNSVQLDAFWGTGGNLTFYRNLFRATDTLASPISAGRHTINWSITQFANQQMEGLQISFGHTNVNSLANVFGSADAAGVASTKYNSGASPFTSTIVPAATRSYSNFFSSSSVGYNTGSDTDGSSVVSFSSGPGPTAGYWVGLASGTLFQHGNFDIATSSVIWNGSITHTLPASFYKSSKPIWFGSVAWPAIGPDVTGGNVDATTLAGHANAIPAEACYNSESRDATGIKLFDPTVCYRTPSATFSPTSVTFPNTNVSFSSSPIIVTFTNSGGSTMTGISISITGTNAGDFSQTNTCSSSLAQLASCTISVTFTPSATGSRSASISVSDSAPGSPHTAGLSGTGVTGAPPPAAGGNVFMRQVSPNSASTGTVINKLAELTGNPSTVVIAGAGDAGGVVGIVVAGAGTAGNATLQLSGPVPCVFDGATTAGDYVQISGSTAGDCHDSGASYPTSNQVLGRVLSTNGSGGAYTMNLFPAEISATPATVKTRGFGTSFGDTGGSALTSGSVVYFTVPYACTIGGWNASVDAGTVTFDIWKIATGTAIPTVTNTITASALPAISTGTSIHSTTLTGWTTSVTANDIFGIQLKTVATAKYAELDIQCNE